MTAIKIAVWADGNLFSTLWPYFEAWQEKGILDVVALAHMKDGRVVFSTKKQTYSGGVSCHGIFLPEDRGFFLAKQVFVQAGIPANRVWDARIVRAASMDWQLFLSDKVVSCPLNNIFPLFFSDTLRVPYIREYQNATQKITLGRKTYIEQGRVEGSGEICVGDFTSISWGTVYELGLNGGHDYHTTSTFDEKYLDWPPEEAAAEPSKSRIVIGSDVWIARGASLKAAGKKPLVIGDGAVIAADSVVVKNVPPFAIVGGNPARFIKWRFSEDVRKALLHVGWWHWPIEKIHQYYHLFAKPEEFLEKAMR